MIKRSIIILTVFCATVCCNNALKDHVSFYGEYADNSQYDTIALDMYQCDFDSSPLCPWACCFLDSLFVVYENNEKVTNNYFKVYYNDKLVSEFGTSGNGPDDYLGPILTSEGKTEHGAFYVTEKQCYSKTSIKTGNYQAYKTNLELPDDFILANKILNYNDTTIVATKTGEYQLQCYNRKTGKTNGYNYYENSIFSGASNFSLTMELLSSVYSANKQYIVIAYEYLKMIDIVSVSDMSLRKRVCFKNFDVNKFEIKEGDNVIFDEETAQYFFSFVVAEEDSFYVLCWDALENDESMDTIGKIYQFDYDGNILKMYQPNIPVYSFAIRNNEIYAISTDSQQEEDIICKGILK